MVDEKRSGVKNGAEIKSSTRETPKLVYFFLILMFFSIINIFQDVFASLRNVAPDQEPPASCIKSIYDDLLGTNTRFNREVYNFSIKCSSNAFSEIDKKFELDKIFIDIKDDLEVLANISEEIRQKNKLLQKAYLQPYCVQNVLSQDKKTLNGKWARNLIDVCKVKAEDVAKTKKELEKLKEEFDYTLASLTPALNYMYSKYLDAYNYYENSKNTIGHAFKVFLLRLVSVLPLFIISMYFYYSLKKKNSPYTIIITFIIAASIVLFIEAILLFLGSVIPDVWINKIFNLLAHVPMLAYLTYYVQVLLVIILFGGIAYLIQNTKKGSN